MTGTMHTPTHDEVLAATRDAIREEFGRGRDESMRNELSAELDSNFDDGTVLKELPGAESARGMRVAVDLEKKFGVALIRKDAKPAETVGQLVNMVMAGNGR